MISVIFFLVPCILVFFPKKIILCIDKLPSIGILYFSVFPSKRPCPALTNTDNLTMNIKQIGGVQIG